MRLPSFAIDSGNIRTCREATADLYDIWLHLAKKHGIDPKIPHESINFQAICDVLSAALGGLPLVSEDRKRGIIELFFRLRWAEYGFPTFQLTHSLAAALLLTDCQSVSGSEIHFPFPAFAVMLPQPDGPITYLDTDGTEVQAHWVEFHSYIQTAHSRDTLEIETLLRADQEAAAIAVWNKAEKANANIVAVHAPEAATLWRIIHGMKPDEDAERWLSEYTTLEDDLDESAQRAAARLMVNLALYLDSLQQDGKIDLKKTPKSKKPMTVGRFPVKQWSLGTEIKLDKHLRDAACNKAKASSPVWELDRRIPVRGHWRNQAHGPARSLRTRRWIEPYIKGPEAAKVITHLYKLDK